MRLITVLIGIIAWFVTLGYRDLIHPDEGRYAELARHIVESGDWITPRLNGILYFEKPAMQYWMTALGFEAFGLNEFAARFWPGLTGALGVLALWFVARRRLGDRVALNAAWILGGSIWWIGNGHFLNLDMGLAFFMTLVLLGFWSAQHDDATPGETRAGMLLAWAAMAGAVLSKGLIGIVLPGAILVVYSLMSFDWRVWRRMHWLGGVALLLAITAPWFIAVSMRNPDFAHFFFVHEHFERFLTTTHRRTGAWWYFIPILIVGLLPFTTLLPGALRTALRRERGHFQQNRLFLAWSAVIFLFFSASSSKLPSYILPMFPAVALLVARHVDTLQPRRLAVHAFIVIAMLATAIAVMFAMPELMSKGQSAQHTLELEYRSWITAGLAIIIVFSLAAAWRARARHRDAAIALLALGSLVGAQLAMQGHQVFADIKSARGIVRVISPKIDATRPFYSVGTFDQTLPFYLRRPVTLVAWVDEFATGLKIEPQHGIATLEEFAQRWRDGAAGAAAMMRLDRFEAYERDGLPMTVIYNDGARVVVVRP